MACCATKTGRRASRPPATTTALSAASGIGPDRMPANGVLGRILSALNPIGPASAQEIAAAGGPAEASVPTRPAPTIVAAHIHEDPLNEEPPEDEEEKQLQEQLKELDDPIRSGPRIRPDDMVNVPVPLGPKIPSGSEGAFRTPAVTKPEGIPDHWIEVPSRKSGGTIWFNPDNPNQRVRVMPGDPNSPYPHRQYPYVVHQDGSFRDVEGRSISGPKPRETPEAHIPAGDFRFRRRYPAPDRYSSHRLAKGEEAMPVDMKLWRNQIRDEVDSVADEAEQRRGWFGIGQVGDSPTELFCGYFDDAAVESFLRRADNGLTSEQAAALSQLTEMMDALSGPETDDPHVLIDDPRWQAVREQASVTLKLLDGQR